MLLLRLLWWRRGRRGWRRRRRWRRRLWRCGQLEQARCARHSARLGSHCGGGAEGSRPNERQGVAPLTRTRCLHRRRRRPSRRQRARRTRTRRPQRRLPRRRRTGCPRPYACLHPPSPIPPTRTAQQAPPVVELSSFRTELGCTPPEGPTKACSACSPRPLAPPNVFAGEHSGFSHPPLRYSLPRRVHPGFSHPPRRCFAAFRLGCNPSKAANSASKTSWRRFPMISDHRRCAGL